MRFILFLLFYGFIFIGWSANIYKLCKLDFEPSYKAEIIRGVGIVVFPMGVIIGYMDIKDHKPSTNQ